MYAKQFPFDPTTFRVEDNSRTVQGLTQKFKDFSRKNGIQGLFETVQTLFDIQDLPAREKETVFIPPKRQSKSEQFKKVCLAIMKIANNIYLRVHVERALRRIKRWHIFAGVLP